MFFLVKKICPWPPFHEKITATPIRSISWQICLLRAFFILKNLDRQHYSWNLWISDNFNRYLFFKRYLSQKRREWRQHYFETGVYFINQWVLGPWPDRGHASSISMIISYKWIERNLKTECIATDNITIYSTFQLITYDNEIITGKNDL